MWACRVVLPVVFLWASITGLPGGSAVAWSAQQPAATDPLLESLQARADQFLADVAAGEVQTACEQFLSGSPLLKQSEAVEKLVEKIQALKQQVGACRAYEMVTARRIGSDVVLMRYVVKCDDFPVVWSFVFYRPPAAEPATGENAWRVVSLRFDTQIDLLDF